MSVFTSACAQDSIQGLSTQAAPLAGPASHHTQALISRSTFMTKSRLTKIVLAVTLGLGMPMLASAKNNPAPSVRADAPDTYIVKKGDTLWDISGKYLKDAWRWKEIWAVNPQVKNPHWIYPGDRLILCVIKGHKVVGVDMGDGCVGVERRMNGSPEDNLNTVKLQPKIHIDPLNVAVPAVPLSAIKSWLINADVVSASTLKKAPYVLATKDRHVIAGKGDTVYVRGGNLVVGDSYGIYRAGEAYVDPETKEILGYEARLIARGTATALNSDVSTIELTDSVQQEVRADDKVLPEAVSNEPGVFYPTNSENIAPGRLIRVLDGIDTAAVNSTIALNRGEREGVAVGQVFAIYRRGALVQDSHDGQLVRLPSERAGLAMVFRTFAKLSYAIVLESNGTIKTGDELRPPVSTGD
ncbi:LysM peptidoglycan-binding domain-containing protein [Aquirhabdus parva]|nr:LysM peptidoglycan-binding domain-containing protein [Aquirhabdus parva]